MKIGMRLNQLTAFVQRQLAPVVCERVDDHGGVLASFDNFVEVANGADSRGGGQRAVEPAGAVGLKQVAAHQVGRRHVFVAGHGDERLAQAPGHVLDKARFAAACGAFDHDWQAGSVGGVKQGDFVGLGLVEGLFFDLVGGVFGGHFWSPSDRAGLAFGAFFAAGCGGAESVG